MAHQERLQTECPPDAHKVIRPPENEVNATICVRLNPAESQKYGINYFCDVLSLLSARPMVLCEDHDLKEQIEGQKAGAQIEPIYLKLDGQEAYLTYSDGSQGPVQPYFDFTAHPEAFERFFEELGKKQFLIVPPEAMLILRSISTVYPWDKLLAGDFLRQFLKATADLQPGDRELLLDIRYGQIDGFSIKETNPTAYAYLRLERKLFLQYPTEDD